MILSTDNLHLYKVEFVVQRSFRILPLEVYLGNYGIEWSLLLIQLHKEASYIWRGTVKGVMSRIDMIYKNID